MNPNRNDLCRPRRSGRSGIVLTALVALAVMNACGSQRGTIGARLGRDSDGHVFVREVPEGLGAAKAGLKAGDEVLLIAGQDVRELSVERLHAVLSGELGSRIRLTLQRGERALRVVVERTAPRRSRVPAR
jgi:C-terminal processing protease CtpA/Prc